MDEKIAVDVQNASMHFNMASEKINSLREYITKLTKRQLFYKDFVAVQELSFQVKKGEIFGIVGTNGSGKSTLLKMIAGVLTPTTGKIITNGKIAPLIELGAGFDAELTGRENIELNGAILGYSQAFIDEHYDEIVDFAEIGDFIDVPVKNYSSGMKARLAFSIATSVNPDILILDEVLSVGDASFQKKSKERMNELMQGDVSLLFVSHSIGQVREMCDRAIWLDHGNLMMDGDVDEVCDA